jgi:SAM-dependent methyltransferase
MEPKKPSVLHKLRRSLSERGVVETIRVCLDNVRWFLHEHSRTRRQYKSQELSFDREFGVETTANVPLGELTIVGKNKNFGGMYTPASVENVQKILSESGIDFTRFSFIDVGCGKGRVLLAAAHFPFRQVIGVEFGLELCKIAEENIRKYHHPDQVCFALTVHWADASTYEWPEDDLFLFMYNPFDVPVMEPVLANLRKSLIRSPRKMIVLYLNPTLKPLFDGCDFLRLMRSDELHDPIIGWSSYAMYEAVTPAADVITATTESQGSE